MKRILAILMLLSIPAMARERIQGWCTQGGQTISVLSYTSSTATPVMRSYAPGCSVKVFISGSGTLATIYSTSSGTSLANPFTASSTGYWFFYADNGHYDVQMSGGGIPSPFTLGDLEAMDLSVSLPIVNTSGTLSCPTCMTLDTAQTVTGVKTFDAPIFIGANQITDTNAFSAWGGASLNDSTALGYVVSNIDHTWVNQDNESRGVSAVVRFSRSTIDEQTYGWDQFGVACVVVTGSMTMPSDPIYGSPYIRGQQKPCVSELYYQPSASPYTANIGMNYLASLAQVGAGVTVNTYAGMIVASPGGFGGGGGHVVTGYGLWVLNLDDATHIMNSSNVAAIKLDGLGNFGRILWQGAEAYSPVYGTLEFSASTRVQTADGVGFKVGGSAANAGMAAGSYAVGGVTLINSDHSISTDAYINTSSKFEISGVTAIDSGRNGAFVGLSASGLLTINVTGMTQCLHVNSLGVVSGTGADCGAGGGGGGSSFPGSVTANTSLTNMAGFYVGGTGVIQYDSGSATISIGNIYNLTATGDIVTSGTHHVGSGNGTPGGYYLGTSQIITGAGAGSLASLALTGAATTGITAQCLHVDTSGNITGTGADCGSGGGGPSFTGSVTANTGGTSGAGFFVDTTGIIQCDSTSCTTISIGNVYNVTATGDVVTSGVHHVGSGTDATNGGYWLGTTQIITGTGQITTNITGSVQCLHVNSLGVVSGTGADCGSGGGGGGSGAYSCTVSGVSSQACVHNLSTSTPLYQCYGTPGVTVRSATPVNANELDFVFSTAFTGSCLLASGGGGGGVPGGSNTQLQYNNSGVFGGTADFMFAGHSLEGGASAILDMSSAATTGVLLPGAFTTGILKVTATTGALTSLALSGTGAKIASTTGTLTTGHCVEIDASGNFVDAAAACGGGGGGGNPFAGSVTANTSLADTAGFYINTIGVIQWSTSLNAVNIGNVFNINSNSGNIVTCQMSGGSCVGAGTGHVGSGSGAYGGYYIYNTQIIDGSANAHFGTINGSSGTLSGSVTANTALTNMAGFYIQMPSSNPGGYTGNTGIIQYAPGNPSVVNIGHVYNITADGDIVTQSTHHVDAGTYYLGGVKYLQASSGSLQVLSGLLVQYANGTYGGVNAGSYAISGATIIDGSANVSTTGYINTSNAFEVGGTTVINSSRGGTFTNLTATGTVSVASLSLYGGGTLINSSGVFSGSGVDTAYGISSAGYSIIGGYNGVTGTGVCTQYRGGICTSF